MRLINADKLKEQFRQLKGEESLAGMFAEEMVKMVEEQPTAYDLDKVVEDLERYARSDICGDCKRCRNIDTDNITCEQCGVLGALEIVKRGFGVESGR